MADDSFATPRMARRVPFIAEAELLELQGGGRMVARISEISSQGCYVDTLNPFPVRAALSITIRHGGAAFQAPAKVIYTHAGFGMGLLFGEMPAFQRALLDSWLDGVPAEAR